MRLPQLHVPSLHEGSWLVSNHHPLTTSMYFSSIPINQDALSRRGPFEVGPLPRAKCPCLQHFSTLSTRGFNAAESANPKPTYCPNIEGKLSFKPQPEALTRYGKHGVEGGRGISVSWCLIITGTGSSSTSKLRPPYEWYLSGFRV